MSAPIEAAAEQEPGRKTTVSDWLRIVLATLARVLLGTVVGLLAWAALPVVIGWHATTVVTGSMEPRILVGDVAVARPLPASAINVGQVLLFDDPDHRGRLRLHRLVRIDDDGRLVTRGDANPGDDSTHVDRQTVRGVGTLRVPYVGLPRVWWQEGQLGRLAAAGMAVVVLLVTTTLDRNLRREGGDPESGGTGSAPNGGEGRSNRRARRRVVARGRFARGGTALLSSVALSSSVLAVGPASAVLKATVSNPKSSLAASTYYTCAGATMADAPGIYYKLDETTGSSAADSSGNAVNGTYQGSPTRNQAKACRRDTGSAVAFNGTDAWISSATQVAAPNVFSLEVWVKTNTNRGGRLVGLGNGTGTTQSTTSDRHLYMTNVGRIMFGVRPSSGYKTVTSSKALNDGSWHHVVATLSSAGLRLYVDGELDVQDPTVTSGAAYTGSLRVGWDNLSGWPSQPTSYYFAGTLDNVAAYTTALSATQVARHYDAGV